MKKIAKSLTVEETADMLETDISVIKRIYDIKASNPEYGEKEIFEAMQKESYRNEKHYAGKSLREHPDELSAD